MFFELGIGALLAFTAVLLLSAFRILREYERGVVFQLGRFWRVKGPGLVLLIPGIQQMVRVDLRTVTQSLLTANATEVTLLHIRRERLNQRVDLHLALGGSFDGAPAAAVAAPPSPNAGGR